MNKRQNDVQQEIREPYSKGSLILVTKSIIYNIDSMANYFYVGDILLVTDECEKFNNSANNYYVRDVYSTQKKIFKKQFLIKKECEDSLVEITDTVR